MKISHAILWTGVVMLSTQVHADDCDALLAEHGDSVYKCMLVANDGTSTAKSNSCFIDLDAGFTWLSKQGALVKGQFLRADCRNKDGTVRYRDWAKAKGLTVDPSFREPQNITSPAAESAAGQRRDRQ